MQAKVLLIYTGGTIGMMVDQQTQALVPFEFNHLETQIPELKKFDVQIEAISFAKPIDSSNMSPKAWVNIAEMIEANYHQFDGFVILHGSDTMAFSASALSFMLEGLQKPVIFTGSQLPIGQIRTDGKENLITAIEIASTKINGKPPVSEVCLFFEDQLFRGNRTHKFNTEHFEAFGSPNYPKLAKAGIHIKYYAHRNLPFDNKNFKVHKNLNTNIQIVHLFPGINPEYLNCALQAGKLKAIILLTFGSGNAPTNPEFIHPIKTAIDQNILVLNITQCAIGSVKMGKYETSTQLKNIGVLSGGDMTLEAAITKLMHLFGTYDDLQTIKKLVTTPLKGELTNENE